MSGINLEKYEFTDEKLTLPKGKYIVVDPCYIIGEDPFWLKYCEWMFSRGGADTRPNYHFIRTGEHLIYSFGTAYGDGCYPVLEDNNRVGTSGVDAGMLCLCPLSFIDEHDIGVMDGTVVNLKYDSQPRYDEGNVECANITVITGDSHCDSCGEMLNDNQECPSCDYSLCEECGEPIYYGVGDLCGSCQEEADSEEDDEEGDE